MAYIVDEATGCWNWQRAKSNGYGRIGINGRVEAAYRVYYERANGPIPTGLHIDHLCRNPACVNPDHLEPVTAAENVRRGAKAKLTDEKVIAARREFAASGLSRYRFANEAAERYGVGPNTLMCALARRTWRHLP